MANLHYAGEKWKISGTLKDSQDVDIAFADLVSFVIEVFDERFVTKTYTKEDGDIVQGSTSASYSVEIPETDTIDFCEGKIKAKIKIEFPSEDFSTSAVDIICSEILKVSKCL